MDTSGELRDRIEGRASAKASRELRTGMILIEYLKSVGGTWTSPRLYEGPREEGIDVIAEDGEKILNLQMTTPEHTAWAELAKQPEIARSDPAVDQAVEAVRTAIERKTLFADRHEIVLALDATDSPRYALHGVVEAFRAQYGHWARGVGYEAIWMVGPVANLVQRLDIGAPYSIEQVSNTPGERPRAVQEHIRLRDWVGAIGRVLLNWSGISLRRPRRGYPRWALGFGSVLIAIGVVLLLSAGNPAVYLIVVCVGGLSIVWAVAPQDDRWDE